MMKEDVKEIVLKAGVLTMLEDGLGTFRINVVSIELDHVADLVSHLDRMNLSSKLKLIVDGRALKEPMKANAKAYASKSMEKYLSRVAFIENSSLLRFLVHTFVAIYRPRIEIKMFKTNQESLEWLKS